MRLAALTDAPAAFLGSFALEQTLAGSHWREECVAHRWLMATVDGTDVGIAKILTPVDEYPHMESVWVRRAFRRDGVARALIENAEDLVRGDGGDILNLWVIGGNELARRTYLALGYTPVGRVKPIDHPGREEEEFSKKLR